MSDSRAGLDVSDERLGIRQRQSYRAIGRTVIKAKLVRVSIQDCACREDGIGNVTESLVRRAWRKHPLVQCFRSGEQEIQMCASPLIMGRWIKAERPPKRRGNRHASWSCGGIKGPFTTAAA